MIVKNEELFLEKCIKSVKEYVNDIVVVDTGSEDRTKEIAVANGARVFDFKWCDDFSAARNFAAGKAFYNWVFVLDADEVIEEFDIQAVDEFIKKSYQVGVIYNYEASEAPEITYLGRLYHREKYAYTHKIHEQLAPLEPIGNQSYFIKIPIKTKHFGYTANMLFSRNKLERNERLLLEELNVSPNEPYFYYQLGKTYAAMSKDLDKACQAFEKALSLYPDMKLRYSNSLVICYGYALINAGYYKKAMDIEKYAKYYQNDPYFRFLMAHIYQNNGLLVEAVETYESCIGAECIDFRGVTSYLSYYNIAVILECINLIEDAMLYYAKCKDYKPAKERLKYLRNL